MAYEVREEGVFVGETRCFVRVDGGVLHAMVRATDKTTFDEAALQVGLKVLNEDGSISVPRSVDITELGEFVITPATYDEQGNELTPAVVDSRYHANFWIDLSRADTSWQEWAPLWTTLGVPAAANKNENALKHIGVELIDPNTVATPYNVLL